MRFISLIDNPFSRVEPTCPSVRIEIKLFPIVSDGVYWTTLARDVIQNKTKVAAVVNFIQD